MKRILPLLALGAIFTLPVLAQSSGPAGAPPTPSTKAGPPPGGHPAPLTDEQKQELKAARQAAFQADPTLEAEGKDLDEKMKDHQKKVDAAMIKADPKIAPLVAQIEATHQHHDGPGGPPPPPPSH